MNKGQENQVEKKEQKKRIAANTLYTMGGLIFMNGVLQLIITPLLNRYMGAKQLGELLYITGLVAIICPSIGQALNTSRLVVRRSHEVTNGDFCCLECWEAVWRCLCQETVSEGSLWVSGYLPFLW